jgi:ketosteroid isomerase-like protein
MTANSDRLVQDDETRVAAGSIEAAKEIVRDFLQKSMIPDPEAAAAHLAKDAEIRFTGATRMHHPREMAAYNAKRYKWVKKQLGPMDASTSEDGITVYSFGTLYGEWPDGEAFSNNRYVDRFIVKDGKISKIDVLNDSAERILERQGKSS